MKNICKGRDKTDKTRKQKVTHHVSCKGTKQSTCRVNLIPRAIRVRRAALERGLRVGFRRLRYQSFIHPSIHPELFFKRKLMTKLGGPVWCTNKSETAMQRASNRARTMLMLYGRLQIGFNSG